MKSPSSVYHGFHTSALPTVYAPVVHVRPHFLLTKLSARKVCCAFPEATRGPSGSKAPFDRQVRREKVKGIYCYAENRLL